ncbi:MAG: ABC transporter ATP-binding protein [Candidatus Vogelbacteria bacterium]|nr:ABC transporter ATP-binding protein [Candidatus Vogelbacteria bacterium]
MKKGSDNSILHMLQVVWYYADKRRGKMVQFCAMTAIANCIALFSTVVIGWIFNDVQSAVKDPTLFTKITELMLLVVFLDFLFWTFHSPSRLIERKNAFLVRHNFRKDVISKVIDLPVEWHKNHHSGDTIDKINQAADDLHDFASSIFQIVENSVRLFGATIILLFFDYRASLIAFCITILALIIMTEFDITLRRMMLERNKFKNHMAAAIQDYITNIYTIITLKLKSRVMHEVEARSWAFDGINSKINRFTEVKWFTISMLISLMVAGVIILNAQESVAATGTVALGTLFVLYRYLMGVGDTFYNFAWRYGEILREHSSIITIESILRDHDSLPTAKKASLPTKWSVLEINGLKFTYSSEENGEMIITHIDNVNLKLPRQGRIAFIGESGSGKSTTMSLLRGLHFTESAQLLVDGKEMPRGLRHLYDHVTLIPQEPEVFNSSVRDNITMDTVVSDYEVKKAIKMAQFESVLKRLPYGLDTNVMEKGVSLSGGEKQRLALARGLLAAKDSDFLLLDEPTSSVDSTNEMKIYENIILNFKKKTIIATIHRLHLLQYFDYIYMFDKGEIIADGTLEHMLTKNMFKEIWDKYNRSKTDEIE